MSRCHTRLFFHLFWTALAALSLVLALSGCQSASPEASLATNTPPPAATHTPLPTATSTPTATTAPTSTPTPLPTATHTVTPTPTPLPSLVVIVMDAEAEQPIVGAVVKLSGTQGGLKTDAQGQVVFSNLDGAAYTLTVTAEGYEEESVEVKPGAGENLQTVNLIPLVFAEVTTASGDLRSGPGEVYPALGEVKEGDRLQVTGKSEDGDWLVVATEDGAAAWLWSGLCTVEGTLDQVQVVDTPPTPTPAPTSTPAPTFTPTATPPPTATPTPAVTVYPQSGIEPWNPDAFRVRLNNLHESLFLAKQWLSGVLTARRFYCENYAHYYDSWVTAAVFTDVPPDWMPLYLEYRDIIDKSVTLTHSMYSVCMGASEWVPVQEAMDAHAHIDQAEIRLLTMIEEAAAK